MTFQKPAPAPKCSTQSALVLVGRRNHPVPWSKGLPGLVNGAHAAGGVGGEDPDAVDLAVAQVQAKEPAGVQNVAHQAAVGGPVHVERVQ